MFLENSVLFTIMKTVLRSWGVAGCIILVMAAPLHAQNIAVNFNSGYVGYGGNFPLGDNYDAEVIFTLFNVGIEHTATNIGFDFSPFKVSGWSNSKESVNDNDMNFSFLNLHLYWNAVNLADGFFYLGPFTSVNYLFVGEHVYWDKFIFTAGGQIGFRLNLGRLNYNIISSEIGYRNISGKNQYFVGVKVDVLSFVLFVILASGSEEYERSKSLQKIR